MPLFRLLSVSGIRGANTTNLDGSPHTLYSDREKNGANIEEVAVEWVQEVRLEEYPVYSLSIKNINTRQISNLVVTTDTSPPEVISRTDSVPRSNGVASPASRARQSRENRRRIRQGIQQTSQEVEQAVMPEVRLVPYHLYTAPVIRGSIDVDDAYHTFLIYFVVKVEDLKT